MDGTRGFHGRASGYDGGMANALERLSESRPAAEKWAAGAAHARGVMAELVVDAWLEGGSYRQIAAASGYSHQRVHQIVRAALAAADAA